MLDLIKISRCLESYDYVMAMKIRMELKFQVKILQKKKNKWRKDKRGIGVPSKGRLKCHLWVVTMLVDLLVEFMILKYTFWKLHFFYPSK